MKIGDIIENKISKRKYEVKDLLSFRTAYIISIDGEKKTILVPITSKKFDIIEKNNVIPFRKRDKF
jgi:hypothetical protein